MSQSTVNSGDGTTDNTAEWTAAQAADEIIVPAGTYVLDNFRPKSGKVFRCAGYKNTIIKQGNMARPAINCLSDASTGQIIGLSMKDFSVVGTGAGTVAAVVVSATAPYVVNKCEFDFVATNTNTALEIDCTGGNEVYSNKFRVDSFNSLHTAFKTKGAYNRYDLIAEQCQDGTALIDGTICGIFDRCVTDGSQYYGGQNCTIHTPTVETIFGSSVYTALDFIGYNHTVFNPTLTEVAQAKISGVGIRVHNTHTLINPRVWGTDYPTYPFGINGASTLIGGSVSCGIKLSAYMTPAALALVTFVGDSSSYR